MRQAGLEQQGEGAEKPRSMASGQPQKTRRTR